MVEKIIHISDVHIRTGNNVISRYDEYHGVFTRLVSDLSKYDPVVNKQAIIILAGDIFHHKLKIESSGLKLALDLINNLAQLAPVYIIRGNHDYRQDCPNEPDLIDSLLSVPIPNVTYWNQTGVYLVDNIAFGLVAIQDALWSGNTCGIAPELPLFPQPPASVHTKIALFHGAIGKTKLANGTFIDGAHSYPLNWFTGYDVVMLGDIHLQQVNNGKRLTGSPPSLKHGHSSLVDKFSWANEKRLAWAYSGSLVQQDAGEALIGHGFMIWDVPQKTIECYHVPNDYGYITVRKRDVSTSTNISIEVLLKNQHSAEWTPIQEVTKIIPKYMSVRVVTQSDNYDDMRDICAVLNQEGKQVIKIAQQHTSQPLQENNAFTTCTNDGGETSDVISSDLNILNTASTWVEFVSKHMPIDDSVNSQYWQQWFHDPNTLLLPPATFPESLYEKINDRNAKLTKRLSEFQSLKDAQESFNNAKHPFHIDYVEWDYILCYRDGNHFNFQDLKHRINSISAKNGVGKTSFLEVICIALYGEGFPSRSNKTFSASIICHEKPQNAHAKTCIYITIKGIQYAIRRVFSTHSSDVNKLHCIPKDVTIDVITHPTPACNIHSGKTAVDQWVTFNIGSIDAFLLSCMISQNSDMDFFNIRPLEQKELLDKAVMIDASTEFQNILKDTKTYYSSIIDISKCLLHASSTDDHNQDDVDILNKKIADINVRLRNIEHVSKYTLLPEHLTTLETGITSDVANTSTSLSAVEYKRILDTLYEDATGATGDNTDALEDLLAQRTSMVLPVIGHDIVNYQIRDLENKWKIYWDDDTLKEKIAKANRIKRELEEYQENLSQGRLERDMHMSDQPTPPRSSREEYDAWCQKCEELNVFEIATSAPLHPQPPPVPYEQVVAELKQLVNTQCFPSEDELPEVLRDMKHRLDTTNEELQVTKDDYMRWLEKKPSLSRQPPHDSDVKRMLKESTNMLTKLNDKIAVSDWVDDLKSSEECLDNLKSISEAMVRYENIIHEHKSLLASLTRENHPFNKDCWACQQQPWRVQMLNIQSKIDKYQKHFDKYAKKTMLICGCEESEDATSVTLENISELVLHVECLEERDRLTREITELNQYFVYMDFRDSTKERIKSLEARALDIQTELDRKTRHVELRTLLSEWNAYHILKKDYDRHVEVESLRSQKDMWDTELQRQELWDAWISHKQELDIRINELSSGLNNLQRKYNKYEKYNTIHQQHVETSKQEYQQLLLFRDEWERLKLIDIKISVLRNAHEYQKAKQQFDDAIVRECHDIYDAWHQIYADARTDSMDVLSTLKTDYSVELRLLEKRVSEIHQTRTAKQVLKDALAELDAKYNTVCKVYEIFTGFKSWVYSNKVIPFLQKCANNIIRVMCGDRPLFIECTITGGIFNWFLRDGKSCPPIEKASGFQRFIAGLAMRLALGQLGAASIKCTQLFLDEGFTACDHENLGKVGDFLQNLHENMHFNHIIIVSHLDEVNACAQYHISIHREIYETTSCMHFGSKYHSSDTTKQKRTYTKSVKTAKSPKSQI